MSRSVRTSGLALVVLIASGGGLYGQASPTATGPGSFVAVGAAYSYFSFPYGKQHSSGYTVFADANLTRALGLEGEFRSVNLDSAERTRFSNLLIGPRYAFSHHHLAPYAKLLVGRGTFTFPYTYAKGSYFTVVPGAGLDLQIGESRASLRLIDFEYQTWPDFTYGAAHPYGVSAGVRVRIF